MKRLFSILIVLVLFACTDRTKNSDVSLVEPVKPQSIRQEIVEYAEGDKTFEGYMVYEDSVKTERPGIILIHHWVGLDDFTKKEADRFAKEGYVVFAMDMYGKDVEVTNHEEAGKISGYYKNNRDIMRNRITTAIDELKKNKYVAEESIGVIGYCFGGDALIDYMLYTEGFKAGVSFHGFYTSPLAQSNDLKGELQINHGVLDTSSTMDQLKEFMRNHPGIEVYLYNDAAHAYTVPEGPNYDQEAAEVSFERAVEFLNEELD